MPHRWVLLCAELDVLCGSMCCKRGCWRVWCQPASVDLRAVPAVVSTSLERLLARLPRASHAPARFHCCPPTTHPTNHPLAQPPHPPAVGDTIPINYNSKRYFIDIIEAKPGQAISVIETDCNVSWALLLGATAVAGRCRRSLAAGPQVAWLLRQPLGGQGAAFSPDGAMDAFCAESNVPSSTQPPLQVDFAPPLDYVEPQRQPQQPVPMAADVPAAAGAAAAEPAAAEPEEPKFLAFAGTGRRLDGKPVSESRPIAIPLAGTSRPGASTSGPGSAAGTVGGSEGPGSAAGSAPKRPGKVFGGNRLQAKLAEKQSGGAGRPPQPPLPPAEKKEEEDPKFKAFSGKGYSLKG